MAKQILRISMGDWTRDPNLADIVAVELRDEQGTGSVAKMTDVARAILQRVDSFFYTTPQGRRAEVEAWTVYDHPFIRTRGGIAGQDELLLLPRF